MDVNGLVEIGFTENQAKVYISLVRGPEQTAGQLAKKLSIDRSFVYSILNSLMNKGLVSHIVKENRTVFFPLEPENLLKEVEEKMDKTLDVIERLKSIECRSKQEKSVKVYEGKAGLKAYVRDFLETDDFCTFGGGESLNLFEELKYSYPQYLRDLVKKKITGRLITSKKNKQALKIVYKDADVKIKTLENINSQVSFTIFKNKIAIYSVEEKPFVILIEDKNISDALRSYFDALWNAVR